MRSRIIGTGSYLPESVISNADLAGRLGTSDDWIVGRTGIRERRAAGEGQTTSDLALEASRRALESCGLAAEDLELIVVATTSGDTPTPATAAFLQARLGARRAFAFDVSAACAGAVYALAVADQFIRAGTVRRALVVGAEVLTRFVDWDDRNTAIIFGDGAGALVLEAGDGDSGILSTHLHTDGSLAEILWIPGLGARHPASPETLEKRLHKIHMNGREVFRVAVRALVGAAEEALQANGIRPEQLGLVVSHQANVRIIEAAMDRLGVPMERCQVNIDRCGNTAAASVPTALDEAVRSGRLRPGDLVLLLAVGAGVTWGSALVRW